MYENNPRKNDDAVDKVAQSIKEFGFKVPIIIDKNNVIVAGHTRLKASYQLGLEEVPVIRADDLDEQQVKAFRIADNKVSEIAEWDIDLLSSELEGLEETFTGFDEIELEQLLDIDEEMLVEEDNYDIDLRKEPKARYGDIYQLGNHRVMCGDSTNKEDVDKLLDEKVHCVFTSPPYNMDGGMYETYEDNLQSQEYIDFNVDVVKTFLDKLDGFVFWNISYNMNSRYEFIKIANELMNYLNFREMIIWDKMKAMPVLSKNILTRTYEDIFVYDNLEHEEVEIINLYENRKGQLYNKRQNAVIPNYWKIGVPSKTQLENHKATFPIKLPTRGIVLTTTKGDNVYDPFGGSGTTLIACEQLERNCYMMEYDPVYVDVIINRWETYTGEKAIKL